MEKSKNQEIKKIKFKKLKIKITKNPKIEK
jgi:hypothetical protein